MLGEDNESDNDDNHTRFAITAWTSTMRPRAGRRVCVAEAVRTGRGPGTGHCVFECVSPLRGFRSKAVSIRPRRSKGGSAEVTAQPQIVFFATPAPQSRTRTSARTSDRSRPLGHRADRSDVQNHATPRSTLGGRVSYPRAHRLSLESSCDTRLNALESQQAALLCARITDCTRHSSAWSSTTPPMAWHHAASDG